MHLPAEARHDPTVRGPRELPPQRPQPDGGRRGDRRGGPGGARPGRRHPGLRPAGELAHEGFQPPGRLLELGRQPLVRGPVFPDRGEQDAAALRLLVHRRALGLDGAPELYQLLAPPRHLLAARLEPLGRLGEHLEAPDFEPGDAGQVAHPEGPRHGLLAREPGRQRRRRPEAIEGPEPRRERRLLRHRVLGDATAPALESHELRLDPHDPLVQPLELAPLAGERPVHPLELGEQRDLAFPGSRRALADVLELAAHLAQGLALRLQTLPGPAGGRTRPSRQRRRQRRDHHRRRGQALHSLHSQQCMERKA